MQQMPKNVGKQKDACKQKVDDHEIDNVFYPSRTLLIFFFFSIGDTDADSATGKKNQEANEKDTNRHSVLFLFFNTQYNPFALDVGILSDSCTHICSQKAKMAHTITK